MTSYQSKTPPHQFSTVGMLWKNSTSDWQTQGQRLETQTEHCHEHCWRMAMGKLNFHEQGKIQNEILGIRRQL